MLRASTIHNPLMHLRWMHIVVELATRKSIATMLHDKHGLHSHGSFHGVIILLVVLAFVGFVFVVGVVVAFGAFGWFMTLSFATRTIVGRLKEAP